MHSAQGGTLPGPVGRRMQVCDVADRAVQERAQHASGQQPTHQHLGHMREDTITPQNCEEEGCLPAPKLKGRSAFDV